MWPFGSSRPDAGARVFRFRGKRILHRPGFDRKLLRQVCRKNEYESVCPGLFDQHYRTLVDVGANIGAVTVGFSDCFDSAYAFEPSAANFALLQRSVTLNRLAERTDLFNVGIGSRDGTAELFAFMTDHDQPVEQEWNYGAKMLFFNSSRHRPEAREEIQLKSCSWFETVLPEEIDLLKVDCEGAEEFLFYSSDRAGLSSIVGERTRRFVAEFHPGLNSELGVDHLLKLLEERFRLTLSADWREDDGGIFLIHGERR